VLYTLIMASLQTNEVESSLRVTGSRRSARIAVVTLTGRKRCRAADHRRV